MARFRLYRYTLHYEANGGTGEMDDQIFQHGQAYPLKKCAFSREGYRFVGWATEPAGEVKYEDQKNIKLEKEFQNLTNDNEKVTLYAVWQEQSVTIGYVSSDTELGTVTVGSETIRAVNGTPAGSTAQPVNGARFDGWYSADGTLLSTDLTFIPTRVDGAVWQGTTYYARFSARRRPSTPSTPQSRTRQSRRSHPSRKCSTARIITPTCSVTRMALFARTEASAAPRWRPCSSVCSRTMCACRI